MAQSPNLDLPYISVSQAQKHITHNEAIATLDTLVQLAVESRNVTIPPVGGPEGVRYIVPSGATGAWAGHTGQIAQQEIGGWRFTPPSKGLRAWVGDQAVLAVFDGSAWLDYRALIDPLSVGQLGVNAIADATNRLSISSAASLFNHAGASHRLVVNKNAVGHTASLVFQDGFLGHAEMGIAGSDNLSVRVSPDGSAWHDALLCDRNTGSVRLPVGIGAPDLPIRVETNVLTAGFTTTSDTQQPTGLQVTLTPRSAASKFLVRGHLIVGGNFGSASANVTVARDGSKVWPASVAAASYRFLSSSSANSRLMTVPASFEFLDQPATTSPVTYDVRLASSAATFTAHLNLRDSDLAVRGESSLIVTEISG